MIDRYLLRYFLAVIDHGNFTRAAAQCRVTQPTLSVGIAKLETMLDRPLFLRTNRRVALTAAGTRFAVHARRIESEFAEAERTVRDDAPGTPLRIGVIPSLPVAMLETALRAAQGPERIELVEGRMRELTPQLDRGRLDAVLGLVDAAASPLFIEGYAMALPADHPRAGQSQVTAEEMAAETMIVRRHCEALGDISRFFTERGVRPFMAARTTSDERAVGYVRAGLGVTVMPRCFAQGGIVMPALAGFETTRSIGFHIADAAASRLADSAAFAAFSDAIARIGAAVTPSAAAARPASRSR